MPPADQIHLNPGHINQIVPPDDFQAVGPVLLVGTNCNQNH